MAYDVAILQHPSTGQIKEAPLGYSWTMFFFGAFPPLFRGDWKWFWMMLGVALLVAVFTFGLGVWVVTLVSSFIWNKSYLNDLIGKGYRLKGTRSGDLSRVDGAAGYTVPRLEFAA